MGRFSGKKRRFPKTGIIRSLPEGAEVMEGIIEEALPSTTFRVRLKNNAVILAGVYGLLRRRRVRIIQGDIVFVNIFKEDPTRGKIVGRK